MIPDLARHGIVALTAVMLAGGSLSLSQPRAANVFPPVAIGVPSVAEDLSFATVPVMSPAADLTAVGPWGPIPVRDGELHVPLQLRDGEPQTVSLGLSASGAVLGEIQLRYYSSAYYRSLGTPHPGVILLFTTLPRVGAPQWAPGTPTNRPPEDSLAVDVDRWNGARAGADLPAPSAERDEQIRRLFMSMSERNTADEVCAEVPAGIDVFDHVVDGTCSVACHGYARVVRDVLRSSGTPARVISLGATRTTLANGLVVQASEGHQTTEGWDGTRWVWVDGTLGVLRALGPDGTVLSVEEVVTALADPATRDDLSFIRLDAASDKWVTRSYAEQDDAFKTSVTSLFTADKVLSIPDDGRG